METNFNFKSSVCTSLEQSERLLSLGLKKETADMVHIYLNQWDGWYVRPLDVDESIHHMEIPAWSLHRLLSMLPDDAPKIFWILDGASITIEFEDDGSDFFPHKGDIYEGVVNCIEWLIKEGYFNKEYLV